MQFGGVSTPFDIERMYTTIYQCTPASAATEGV